MLEIVPFLPEHARQIRQDGTEAPEISDEALAVMARGPFAGTLLLDGQPAACAGIALYWPGRGEAWAIVDRRASECCLALHRAVRRARDECGVRRVEALVDIDFERGHRWARSLGFRPHSEPLEAYFPSGRSAVLYERVRW